MLTTLGEIPVVKQKIYQCPTALISQRTWKGFLANMLLRAKGSTKTLCTGETDWKINTGTRNHIPLLLIEGALDFPWEGPAVLHFRFPHLFLHIYKNACPPWATPLELSFAPKRGAQTFPFVKKKKAHPEATLGRW